MTFILPAIAFVVAIASQFFEAVKKDAAGQKIYKHRFPVLTTAGRFIFALLLMSFIGTLVSTWLDKKEASGKQKQLLDLLKQVEAQNQSLKKSSDESSTQNQEKFRDSLDRLDKIQKQEKQIGLATAQNIDRSAAALLDGIQAQLVEARYVLIMVAFNGKNMTPEQFPRLGTGRDASERLESIFCAEKDQLDLIELRLMLQVVPQLEYVLARKINNGRCFIEGQIEATGRDGETHKLGVAVNVRAFGANTYVAAAILTKRQLVDAGFSDPLYARAFGNGSTAMLRVIGRSGSEHEAGRTAELLEPRFPKSIAVCVKGRYSLPEQWTEYTRPEVQRAWYLTRGPLYSSGVNAAEYYFEPPGLK